MNLMELNLNGGVIIILNYHHRYYIFISFMASNLSTYFILLFSFQC